MEQNTETKTLSFSKGMTNIPSDNICTDDELMESVGFIYRDGEMKPIQKPFCITGDTPLEGKLVYVHKLADYRNLITYVEDKKQLLIHIYAQSGDTTAEDKQTIELGSKLLDIKHVGNTLVCAIENGNHYLLFKNNKYQDLGTDLPEPGIVIGLQSTSDQPTMKTNCILKELVKDSDMYLVPRNSQDKDYSYDENGQLVKVFTKDGVPSNIYTRYKKYELYTDKEKWDNAQKAIQGHIGEVEKLCKKNKMFLHPFFVRVALKLHDGSYAKISNPIICYPSVRKNVYMVPVWYDEDSKTWKETNADNWAVTDFMYFPRTAHIEFAPILKDWEKWKDIVKEFVVFATKEVVPYKLEETWNFSAPLDSQGKIYADSIEVDTAATPVQMKYQWGTNTEHGMKYPATVIQPTYKSDKEIIEELLTRTQFYKLLSLKTDGSVGFFPSSEGLSFLYWLKGKDYIKDGVLENLEEQEQLPKDDYYGWTKNVFTNMFTYNNRLNSFGIKRYPFRGFDYFVAKKNKSYVEPYGNIIDVTFYVHIVSSKMDRWVKSNDTGYVYGLDGWFYYPDPNATEVIIYRHDQGVSKGRRIQLRQHPMLNGSYSFENLPLSGNNYNIEDNIELPTVDDNACEEMDSQIYTSNVNNPFVFEASGDNTVGTGKILGITANTDAVSQGQFGQFPLLVFTTEGIYALSVNSEGLYSAAYPVSRDVANDNSPFTPTDKFIFFTSKKGLMAVSGGTSACVSRQLGGRLPDDLNYFSADGEPLVLEHIDHAGIVKFLKDCLIAYDYQASLLRIFGKDKSYQYIYNMEDQTFALDNSGIVAQAVVNDYPDNLIQDTDGNVYSLTDKPDVNEDENLYSGTIITRPMKLGSSLILKSLRAIQHFRRTEQGKLHLDILANNNAGKQWCKLPSLFGKPWAFFTFKYTLTDFKACDSFQGTAVTIQNRRSLLRGQN